VQVTIVFAVLLIAVILFVTEVLAIDLIAILMLLGLTLTGVLSVKEGLSGFSDEAVLTIAGFFVISAALFNTGVVEAIGHRIHRISGSNKTMFLLVLMLMAAALASFLSNVVTTAVLMPAVFAISRRLKEPVSKFLMPLSFAAVLGGKCTLVGSSTNLAVNGLLASNYDKYHMSHSRYSTSPR
jgi:di/tricarboxylate transporter